MARRDFRQRAHELAEREEGELDQRVRALAESQWRGPVVVIYLGYFRPTVDVPGRCKDGTVKIKEKRPVRRIFSNILRGIVAVLIMLVVGDSGAGGEPRRKRPGRVTGSKNAQVLGSSTRGG